MEKILPLDIQKFGDPNTPNLSDLTTLWTSDTLTGEKTQICHVQNIPPMKEAKEAITYDALDYETARLRKGGRPNSVKTINFYYTEEQTKMLEQLSNSDASNYYFIKYPDSTIVSEKGAKVFYFKAELDMSNAEMSKGDMLQDTLSLYINTEVQTSFGFPTE